MKELTIEEKAKAYDEALERARNLYKDSIDMGENIRIKQCEIIFPELKESEDELTWLTEYIEEEAYSLSIDIRDNEDRIKLKNLQKALAWLKKQEHLTTDEYEQGKKDVLWCIKQAMKNAKDENDMGICWFAEKWLKKQGEQKSTDKVKPKFKVGDWVIDRRGITDQITDVIENVTAHTYGYDTLNREYFNDYTEDVRLWTIQDAKDGDVLYINNTMSESIMLYKSFDNGIVNKYASYNKFGFEGENYLTLNDGYIIPATKTQRDFLFQKMKEAGYEWDTEKKELRKIE